MIRGAASVHVTIVMSTRVKGCSLNYCVFYVSISLCVYIRGDIHTHEHTSQIQLPILLLGRNVNLVSTYFESYFS